MYIYIKLKKKNNSDIHGLRLEDCIPSSPSFHPAIRTNETRQGMRLSENPLNSSTPPFSLGLQSIICTTTIILWQSRK